MKSIPKIVIIVGPTASGKSELALQVAQKLGGEICSLDAFQVYRGLDIGTGKASAEQCNLTPHHLLNIVDPLEPFSVADYLCHAEGVYTDLVQRGKPMIWVGGTGLYLKALRQGLSPAPASSPEIVQELSAWSLEKLQSESIKCDPTWAATADLKNPRRMIRALAVFLGSGKCLSDWQKMEGLPLVRESKNIYLRPSIEWVREKIQARVNLMWRSGWVQEVRGLMNLEDWAESQSAKAIGYRETVEFISERMSEKDCLGAIINQTNHYAKRQMTWFKSEKEFITLDPTSMTRSQWENCL